MTPLLTRPWTGLRVLARTVTRNGRRLTIGSLLISLFQVCEASVPIVIGIGVDRAVAPGNGLALVLWLLVLAGLFTVHVVMYRFGARQLMLAIAWEAHWLRDELATKILEPRGIRTELRSGELLSVSSTDADNTSYLLDYIPRIAGAITAAAVSGIVLLLIDVPLGLVVLIGTPVVLVALQVAAPLITKRVAHQQDLAGKATSLATDLVSGLRPLRGLGAQRAAARRYRDVSQLSLHASVRAARTQGGYLAAATATSALLACGIALLAGWHALGGVISIGGFITVIGLAQFLVEPLGLLAIVPSWIAESRASANRVAQVLNAPPRWSVATADPGPGPHGLEIAGLYHAGLAGLDLVVRPGELLGVVAPRAADGEALVAVLSGRVAPDEYLGELRLSGVPVRELDLAALRQVLLVEPHHTDLFTGTLAGNVTTGDASVDPATRDAALTAAAADEVVVAHPDGLATAVAERGASLSGGQRQRLALARALLAQPPILVLHDPTTAVDAVTEHTIAAGIRSVRHAGAATAPAGTDARTTIVVTSSPVLLAAADRVVVLADGRLHTEGVHAGLAAGDETYRKAVLR